MHKVQFIYNDVDDELLNQDLHKLDLHDSEENTDFDLNVIHDNNKSTRYDNYQEECYLIKYCYKKRIYYMIYGNQLDDKYIQIVSYLKEQKYPVTLHNVIMVLQQLIYSWDTEIILLSSYNKIQYYFYKVDNKRVFTSKVFQCLNTKLLSVIKSDDYGFYLHFKNCRKEIPRCTNNKIFIKNKNYHDCNKNKWSDKQKYFNRIDSEFSEVRLVDDTEFNQSDSEDYDSYESFYKAKQEKLSNINKRSDNTKLEQKKSVEKSDNIQIANLTFKNVEEKNRDDNSNNIDNNNERISNKAI